MSGAVGMQVAFGRVRRKTAPTGSGVLVTSGPADGVFSER